MPTLDFKQLQFLAKQGICPLPSFNENKTASCTQL
jgi:hypothetical protein